MHGLKSNLLARASLGALAAAAAFTAIPTHAQAQTQLYGGGATLVSLVIRDLFDCYAIPPGGSINSPRPAGCPAAARVNTTASFNYRSVGSGNGQRGWASQERTRLETPTAPGFTSPLGAVTFAASEAALTSSNVGAYVSGGRFSSTGPLDLADQSDNCIAQSTFNPAPGNGQDFVPLTTPTATAGCFDNPRVEAGPPIQVPFVGVGVTIGFDPVYKRVRNADGSITEFTYNFAPRADGSGGLDLTRAGFCGIFSGRITRWNDSELNQGGTALWPDPDDTDALVNGDTRGRRVDVTVRDDDSGTTALFTRALRAQCPAQFTTPLGTAGFAQTYPGNPTPGSIGSTPSAGLTFNNTCDTNEGNNTFPGNWVYARGNEGVAFCLNTQTPRRRAGATTVGGRIGYLSPSFALPVVNVSPFTNYAINTVDLANSSGAFIAPTVASITAGLGTQAVPTGANRADPTQWVANPSGAVAGVSDPNDPAAYPIVGTSNLLLYTCYVNGNIAADFANPSNATPGFLNWLYNTSTNAISNGVSNIVTRQGFVRIPTALGNAIVETFAPAASASAGGADPTGQNLYIRPQSFPQPASPGCSVGAG